MEQQDDWSNSSLSSLSSDAEDQMELETTTMKTASTPKKTTPAPDHEADYFSSISSDTSGSVPNSPSATNAQTDDEHHEQVTECLWDGCNVGDMGDMDTLVKHLHDKHIEGNRQKEKGYTCEWTECARKGMSHASGYALKAHMRSHTREKPFYCALPECDRSFTRSDALAKHMRTVHETEALRPSDPVPKSMQPTNKNMRLKLIVKNPSANATPSSAQPSPSPEGEGAAHSPNTQDHIDLATAPFTILDTSLFTPSEIAMEPSALFRLLRRKVHWAEEESEALKRECETVEAIRKREWLEKEILLDQVIKNEVDWHERRATVLQSLESVELPRGQAQSPTPYEHASLLNTGHTSMLNNGFTLNSNPPQLVFKASGGSGGDQAEAAAVLASLHHGS